MKTKRRKTYYASKIRKQKKLNKLKFLMEKYGDYGSTELLSQQLGPFLRRISNKRISLLSHEIV